MPLPLRKRTIHFYEIHLQAATRSPIQRPSTAALSDILQSFQALATGRKLPLHIASSTKVKTSLVDWRYDSKNRHYELLLNRADAALSDVALRDFDTSNLRKAGKKKTEGFEVSAHVIVRPNSDGQTAAMLLSMGAGIGPAHLERLFRGLSRQASQQRGNRSLFYFDHPSGEKDSNGKAIQYKVQYGYAVHGYQGQTLRDALRSGKFESMELVAHETSPFDAGGTFQVQERSIKISASLPKVVTAATVVNAVRGFVRAPGGDAFDSLRIRYKTAAGKDTGTTLPIHDLDAAFTLKENIEFDTDVQEHQDSLDEVILQKMRPLLGLVPR